MKNKIKRKLEGREEGKEKIVREMRDGFWRKKREKKKRRNQKIRHKGTSGGLKGRCKIDLPKLVEFSKNREKKRAP